MGMIVNSFRFGAGAPPPAGTAQIVILAGQSNATSFQTTGSDVPIDLQGTDSAVRIWNTHTSALEIYEAGVNSDTFNSGAATPQKWGPEASFAKEFRAAYPTTPLVFIKCARNTTSLATAAGDDWSPSSSGELYDILLGYIAAAQAALDSEMQDYTSPIFLWMQGEEDAKTETPAINYAVNLIDLITNLRTDLSAASMPFILGRITPSESRVFANTVRALQTLAADITSDTTAIDLDFYDIAVDLVHLEIDGVRSLGEDYFAAFDGTYQASLPVRFGVTSQDRRTGVVLTNGNLTAEGAGATPSDFYLARCDKFPSTGKYYVEFTIDAQAASLNIGMGRNVALNDYWGTNNTSVSMNIAGNVFRNDAIIQTYASYTAGDTIMLAFDGATGRVWFGKNGTFNGNPAAGTGQATTLDVPTLTVAPRIGATLRRSGDRVTVKPKAADWTYSPPSGFGPF